ncbi:hypothetical protein DPM33_32080 [Mesorhizobium hawassense]|uniref:Uncharacterized protein n=1 Tax=Mesorhizobium hawassense TaxID=1209954 RepID=A0A330H6V1_9HYPH|nr:hypothetical protein [Mesorhizobium hawassense]RAZ84165.1 hypothetical protein DPM33_32080 [Mesorhizobium hawassense]
MAGLLYCGQPDWSLPIATNQRASRHVKPISIRPAYSAGTPLPASNTAQLLPGGSCTAMNLMRDPRPVKSR